MRATLSMRRRTEHSLHPTALRVAPPPPSKQQQICGSHAANPTSLPHLPHTQAERRERNTERKNVDKVGPLSLTHRTQSDQVFSYSTFPIFPLHNPSLCFLFLFILIFAWCKITANSCHTRVCGNCSFIRLVQWCRI